MATVTPRKRKLASFEEKTTSVTVGAQKHSFNIHQDVLISSSKYFQSHLSGRWTVGDSIGLPVHDVEVQTFRLYAQWLYGGDIDFSNIDELSNEKDSACSPRSELLVKLYILGDALEDKDFRNAVMDKVIDMSITSKFRPSEKALSMAFETTHPGSKLCRFFIDDALAGISAVWLEESWAQLPMSFTTELTLGWASKSFHKRSPFSRPGKEERSLYYEMDGDESQSLEASDKKTTKEQKKLKKMLNKRSKI